MEYIKGSKFIWHPINRATKKVESEHPHCGKIVTVIGNETLNRIRISVDDFPECNDRIHVNQFVAEKDELEPYIEPIPENFHGLWEATEEEQREIDDILNELGIDLE